jgi:hypothetical protein
VSEIEPAGYSWDNPALLGPLYLAYRVIYGWQDFLVARLDRLAAPGSPPIGRGFMTAVSVLGLGTQLLVLAVFALLGRPEWALWLLVTAFNAYAGALILSRRRQAL